MVYEWNKIVSLGAKLKAHSVHIFKESDLNNYVA